MSGLALYLLQGSFTYGSDHIHLPKDPADDWFFDKVNRKSTQIFRIGASVTGFLLVLFKACQMPWWIPAIIFVPLLACYIATCFRSFYLHLSDRPNYERE